MKTKNISVFLMLISGIIVGIIGVIYNYTTEMLMVTLIIVLLIFFLIGLSIQIVIENAIKKVKQLEYDKIESELNEEYDNLKEKISNLKSKSKQTNDEIQDNEVTNVKTVEEDEKEFNDEEYYS